MDLARSSREARGDFGTLGLSQPELCKSIAGPSGRYRSCRNGTTAMPSVRPAEVINEHFSEKLGNPSFLVASHWYGAGRLGLRRPVRPIGGTADRSGHDPACQRITAIGRADCALP